jgi:patatin-like phospholipase
MGANCSLRTEEVFVSEKSFVEAITTRKRWGKALSGPLPGWRRNAWHLHGNVPSCLAEGFSRKRNVAALDIGAAFDLIVGTSTGAIIGCALAMDITPNRIVRLYRENGAEIFPRRLPAGVSWYLYRDLTERAAALAAGEEALRGALTDCFGSTTLGQVYAGRRIALAVPAVDLGQHRSWVFKTPHHPNTKGRDDDYSLVNVCMATTAAPLFRSLAAISTPSAVAGERVFADGGLWANNPVLVGVIEALEMTQPGQCIDVFCLGTCPRPAGEDVSSITVNRGLKEWRFGGEAAKLSIDAQEFAYDHMARMLARHVNRVCHVVRFPRQSVPAALMQYLDLDDTRSAAADALVSQASSDADMTNSRCGDSNDPEGQMVNRLFQEMPAR